MLMKVVLCELLCHISPVPSDDRGLLVSNWSCLIISLGLG